MISRYKGLLPIAAIALIGFTGSWVAFAQAPAPPAASNLPGGPFVQPPAFRCVTGETVLQVMNGTNDNFAGTADPKPHPSPALISAGTLGAANIYDQTANDYHFGDTFTLNPSGQITKVRLTTRLKANGALASNDGISFSTKLGFTPGHFSFGMPPGWGPSQPPKMFVFEFDPTGSTVHVNTIAVPNAGYNGATFYSDLNSTTNNHVLHVYLQDDTGVDFVQIELCYMPVPKYNLVATKKHEGSAYTLDVTNAGSAISPTGKIDVAEIVPAGLTITGATVPAPWQCPGVIFPVIGPDAFTCSYPINAVIASGQHLPQIVLKTEGRPECPNCMRARLYLKEVSGGEKPVGESEMKDNASCAK